MAVLREREVGRVGELLARIAARSAERGRTVLWYVVFTACMGVRQLMHVHHVRPGLARELVAGGGAVSSKW